MLSFDQIRELVYRALGKGNWIVELYEDHVIYEDEGTNKFFKVGYSVDDEQQVSLGQAEEVEKKVDYVPLQAACILLAAKENGAELRPDKWRVQVVQFGEDVNGNWWDKGVLTAELSKFEGARVFCLAEGQHQAKPHPFGKPVRDMIGWLDDVKATQTGIEATLVISKAAAWLGEMVADAWEKGKKDLIGLSVDITGKATKKRHNGKRLPMLATLGKVTVDVVYDPAAGGQFLQMAAAAKASPKETNMDGFGNAPAANQVEEMKKMQQSTCSMFLAATLSASSLPEAIQEKLKDEYSGKVFDEATLHAAVKREKEMLDKLTGSGLVADGGHIRVTEDVHDKSIKMLDDFFAGEVKSFKAAYIAVTGDENVTGVLNSSNRLMAAVDSGTFANVLGDAITRKMVAEYNASGLGAWKKLVSVVTVFDFRTQRRGRIGGYGDLPAVAEGNPYGALTTPDDEEATYAATKRGGTEIITLETIKNDDVGAIKRIPQKLARAAARTLYKFVFDFIGTNPTIYDSVALFHASHSNLGAAALDKTALSAGRLAMIKQQEAGSNELLGIPPQFLIVPADLEDTAYELTVQPNAGNFTPNAPDAVLRQTWDIISVKHWTDANNWFLAADPGDIPTIEIGFLDGKEEPELFIQDMPTSGSMFSNDKLTYKIRHIYGGAVLDYRGFYGALVA